MLTLNFTEVVSVIAICISLSSLGVSLYNALRDRGRLKITSELCTEMEDNTKRIAVTIVNIGRRPMILRFFGGTTPLGKSSKKPLGVENEGLRLGEKEAYELNLTRNDTVDLDYIHRNELKWKKISEAYEEAFGSEYDERGEIGYWSKREEEDASGPFLSLWVEDSCGVRYTIPDSHKHIKLLWS